MARYPEAELIHEDQIDGEMGSGPICNILAWLRFQSGDNLIDPVLYVNRCEGGHTKFCLFERIEVSYIIGHANPLVRELFPIHALDNFRMGKVDEDGTKPVAVVVDAVKGTAGLVSAVEHDDVNAV
jgi:hypothetical protein